LQQIVAVLFYAGIHFSYTKLRCAHRARRALCAPRALPRSFSISDDDNTTTLRAPRARRAPCASAVFLQVHNSTLRAPRALRAAQRARAPQFQFQRQSTTQTTLRAPRVRRALRASAILVSAIQTKLRAPRALRAAKRARVPRSFSSSYLEQRKLRCARRAICALCAKMFC